MNKILLLEDRYKRQMDFLEKIDGFNIDEYVDILDNMIEEKYRDMMEAFEHDLDDLSTYDCIIVHNSILVNNKLDAKLKKYCADTQTPLVLFSGSFSESSYTKGNYEELSLSSVDFYSENLKIFLDEYRDGNKNIFILLYGKKWQTNIMLNAYEKINYFIEQYGDEEDLDIDEFKNAIAYEELEQLDLPLYKMEVDGSWVYMEEIVKFKEKLYMIIEDMTDE